MEFRGVEISSYPNSSSRFFLENRINTQFVSQKILGLDMRSVIRPIHTMCLVFESSTFGMRDIAKNFLFVLFYMRNSSCLLPHTTEPVGQKEYFLVLNQEFRGSQKGTHNGAHL